MSWKILCLFPVIFVSCLLFISGKQEPQPPKAIWVLKDDNTSVFAGFISFFKVTIEMIPHFPRVNQSHGKIKTKPKPNKAKVGHYVPDKAWVDRRWEWNHLNISPSGQQRYTKWINLWVWHHSHPLHTNYVCPADWIEKKWQDPLSLTWTMNYYRFTFIYKSLFTGTFIVVAVGGDNEVSWHFTINLL